MTQVPYTPVFKVGAIIARQRASTNPDEGDKLEIMVVRPYPKQNVNDVPNLTLPRGTRKYDSGERDVNGKIIWVDARDAETAQKVERKFEATVQTLVDEMAEEAGIDREVLKDQKEVYDAGEHTYRGYPVQFYVIFPDTKLLNTLNPHPEHSSEVRWCTIEELENLADPDHQMFAPGYVDIIKKVIPKAMYEAYPKVDIRKDLVQESKGAAGRF